MKKTTINISYDEEKLSALKIYLEQKGSQIEDELEKELDALYSKNVPANVREFIDMRTGCVKPAERKKKPKPHQNMYRIGVRIVEIAAIRN